MFRFMISILAACTVAACTVSPSTEKSRAEYLEDLREQRFNRIVVTIRDQRVNRIKDSWSTPRPIAFMVSADDLRKQFFDKGRRIGKPLGLELVDSYPVERLGIYTLVYEAEDQETLRKAVEKLNDDERVESVTPVNTYRTQGAAGPDPLADVLTGLQADTITRLHELSTGEGVRIAIVDTGLDSKHEDLRSEQIEMQDMVSGKRRLPPEEHGTSVTGLIAAIADNGIGIRGIAPDASIIMLRACWQEPGQDGAFCTSDTIAKSLAAALEAEVDIVNLSLTGPPDPLLRRLVEALVEDGVIVIAAHADMEGQGPFPAGVNGVIAVTADPGRQHGKDETSPVFMPGKDVMTLLPGNRYGAQQGSSISAAQVSGLAALFRQRQPAIDAEHIRRALFDSRLVDGDDSGLVQALQLAELPSDGTQLAEQLN